jgi:hypothetical protein
MFLNETCIAKTPPGGTVVVQRCWLIIRDAETNLILRSQGWIVIRAWEHKSPAEVANRIIYAVQRPNPKPAVQPES